MNGQEIIATQRRRRQFRVRNRLRSGRPRLSVFRSGRHIYAQVIDDATGQTLASASSLDTALRGKVTSGGNCAGAEVIGREIAERALAKGIKAVSYDRGPYRFHGRLAKLAEAARAAGLDF
ncbi:50S ribosomal protein L18 [Schlesneria sp.]|uniref:50S ribosomal protein L18 n=1 Tax=Schlesneria sp. TaxID=2762018 RepID=UPI002EED92B3